MEKNDRFGKEWSSGSAAQEYPTDIQAQQGLSFLGATPPSFNLHDAMFMACDWKDNWLFDQIKGVTDAYEQPLNLTVNGTRTALADAISFALVNQQVATELKAGIAPIATQSETDAGTNDTKFITPKKLKAWIKKGFLISLTENGYISFPGWMGGLIIQWGTANAYDGAIFSYPIAFPNAAFSITGNGGNGNNTTSVEMVQVYTRNNSEFTTAAAIETSAAFEPVTSSNAIPCSYIAIGH